MSTGWSRKSAPPRQASAVVDALVFSGGIGENAAPIRAMVLEQA
jgi:acetate kinase